MIITAGTLTFRILGSLEVLADGRELRLGGARQRAVLAILLIHRGEVVSNDRLVDELWGERPPHTATKTVQVYVSRLRKELGGGMLVTHGGGYALEIGAAEVDADRFEQLAVAGRDALDRGDDAAAAEGLREALALWRGRPLADFAYESFAQSEIMRLEEQRLVVLEDRAEADLALGHHAALVPELEALVREHPTRERFRGQLMLALYRSGRQAEALASYRDEQRRLLEVGLEPGADLRRLEQAILREDPALDAPSPSGVTAAVRRRRGGALAALGGAMLLAAAVVAALFGGSDGAPVAGAPPNSVALIDPASNQITATVPTGVQPADVSADADFVWVANRGDDTVTQIDPATRAAISTTPVGTGIGGLAAGDGAIWVGDSRQSELVRLDPEFRSTRSVELAARPDALASSDPGPVAVGEGAVWSRVAAGVARVDPERNEVVARIPVGNDPSAIAIGGGGVWVTDAVDNTVSRIDPAPARVNVVTATTPVGRGPAAVAVGEGAVWVANADDDTVARVDPRTAAVTATIPVGRRPTGIAAGGGSVWVVNSLSGSVSRIDPDTNELEAIIPVGETPHSVTLAHGLVWVSVQARATPPAVAAAEPGDDIVRVLIPDDPGPTDPALDFDTQRQYATCAQLYNYPDRPFPEGAQLQPEVADGEPSVSSDGRTYTFTVRPGFHFSPPSGEPVTAAAFERALERALHPAMGSFAAGIMGDIVGADDFNAGRSRRLSGVSAKGDTLVIELTEPAPDLLARLASSYVCAVPPDTPIRAAGIDAVPSAGPYYVASHIPEQSLVLRRNPGYNGPRPQGVEEIQYEIGVGAEPGVADVEAGRADYVALDPLTLSATPGVSTQAVRELARRYGPDSEAARAGHQQLFTQPTLSIYYFLFNTRRGVFADPKLRKAVNYAIDRRALAEYTGVGQGGRPTDQYIPQGMPGFEDAVTYPLGGPDIATARRLAGTERRQAMLYTCTTPDCARHGEILRSNLRAIGIDLDVRQFPVGEMFDRIGTPGEPFDIAYSNWFADNADPSNFINTLFAPDAFFGHLYEDPGMDRRMAAAARLSGDARLDAYARTDRYLAERAVPAAPFAVGTVTHFLSSRMGCQILHPIYGLDLAALCVDDGEVAE